MRLRFVKPLERSRFLVRAPFTEDAIFLSQRIIDLGYSPATFVQFWSHIVFWRLQRRRLRKKIEELDESNVDSV